jgi:hypothetical protein
MMKKARERERTRMEVEVPRALRVAPMRDGMMRSETLNMTPHIP